MFPETWVSLALNVLFETLKDVQSKRRFGPALVKLYVVLGSVINSDAVMTKLLRTREGVQ